MAIISFFSGLVFGAVDMFIILLSVKYRFFLPIKFVVIIVILYLVVTNLEVMYFIVGFSIAIFGFILLKSFGRR